MLEIAVFEMTLPHFQFAIPMSSMKGLERHTLWLAIAIVMMMIAGSYYVGIKGESRSAFNRWRPNVQELIQGEDIYLKRNFPTPPIMALILYPFTLASAKVGMSLWFGFKAVLTLLSVAMIIRVMDHSREPNTSEKKSERSNLPVSAVMLAIAFAFSARPILGDLLHGNVNLWILFLVCACIWAFHLRKDFSCGIFLALATACKLTPMLLGVYFLWKGAWRVCMGFALGLLIWLFIVPSLFIGFSRNTDLLKNWGHTMVVPYLTKNRVSTEKVNQSLTGLLARLFSESEKGADEDVVAAESTAETELSLSLELSDTQLAMLVKATIAFCVIGLALACRAPIADRKDVRLYHEMSLVLIAMLLISERSWKHHFVTLMPSYFLLMRATVVPSTEMMEGRRRAFLWIVLGLSQVLIGLTSQDLARPFFGKEGAKWFQEMGAFTWSALLLAAAHVICIRWWANNAQRFEKFAVVDKEEITFSPHLKPTH